MRLMFVSRSNDWLLSRQQVALARAEDLEYADSPEELFAIRIWLTNCEPFAAILWRLHRRSHSLAL